MLDLVGRAQRRGSEVGEYFTRHAELPFWRYSVGTVEGHLAILGYDTRITPPPAPGYFILLEWNEGQVSFIRD